MKDEVEAIVMDNGSGCTKVGFAGEDIPRSVFGTTIGTLRDPDKSHVNVTRNKVSGSEDGTFIGNKCQDMRELLALTSPIERGSITKWDDMEKIWDYSFTHELHISPEMANMPVLLTDSPSNSKSSRERMAQIMFETFKVPGFYIVQQSVLSLFASGRTRGLVIESGYGTSHAVPIFEGYALPHAILNLSIAGFDISQYMKKLLAKKAHVFSATEDHVVQHLKETNCFVGSGSFQAHSSSDCTDATEDRPYELPDGSIINIPCETRSSAPEILFQPSLLGGQHEAFKADGIHKLAYQSISMCDADMQKDLYGSVVLAGGTSMLPGFAYRMHKELCSFNPDVDIRIVPDYNGRERGYNTQRKLAAWVGGSMFASLSTFKQIQVKKQEWEESHENIIHRKCF